ncbi:hypothetical protein QF037_009931 [Streptomyces canus]|nr:hypothetical protein [Streptomyces canus]
MCPASAVRVRPSWSRTAWLAPQPRSDLHCQRWCVPRKSPHRPPDEQSSAPAIAEEEVSAGMPGLPAGPELAEHRAEPNGCCTPRSTLRCNGGRTPPGNGRAHQGSNTPQAMLGPPWASPSTRGQAWPAGLPAPRPQAVPQARPWAPGPRPQAIPSRSARWARPRPSRGGGTAPQGAPDGTRGAHRGSAARSRRAHTRPGTGDHPPALAPCRGPGRSRARPRRGPGRAGDGTRRPRPGAGRAATLVAPPRLTTTHRAAPDPAGISCDISCTIPCTISCAICCASSSGRCALSLVTTPF